MDALAGAGPERDLAGMSRIGHIVDAEAALGRSTLGRLHRSIDLVVDQHYAIGGPRLVGVQAFGDGALPHLSRVLGIAHVDDGRAFGPGDVADVGVVAVDDDLPAAGAVKIPDLANAIALAHWLILSLDSSRI